jgi:hypothetical protein
MRWTYMFVVSINNWSQVMTDREVLSQAFELIADPRIIAFSSPSLF